jgi:GR25 family glycosyltransferase involved in LPS biosynthesis
MKSKNVTFVIPIFKLESHRINNLKFILPYILQTGCNIFLVEQSSDEVSDLSSVIPKSKKIKHVLYKSDSKEFHKSGIINWATKKLVKTKYVWANDVDFYMKYTLVMELDWDQDFIKPYSYAKKLSSDDTLKILNGEKLNVSYKDQFSQYISLYGALSFIFNKKAFLKIGGMDETLFGWGKEDIELDCRIKELKIEVMETKLKGIHLWHPIKRMDKNNKFYINYYFDEVYCVNLDRRGDRWDTVKKQFDKHNIRVRRFSAIDGKDLTYDDFYPYWKDKPYIDGKLLFGPGDVENKFALGCLKTHLAIIRDAKENGYEKILIFEDDVVLSNDFENEIRKVKDLDWKMLYLGATQYDWSNLFIGDGLYMSKNTYGTFAYAIDSSIYDLLIHKIQNSTQTIDHTYTHIQNELTGNCYTLYPNIAIPYVNDSDIRNVQDINAHAEKMRWNLSNFNFEKNRKKNILLMPDARGWAFDNIAKAIVKYNPRPDKINYEIMYARDLHQHKCTVEPSEWDLIYVMFEAERIIPQGKNVIRGCYSAYWIENPNHSPKVIGKYFSRCKGAIFANDGLKNKIYPYLPNNYSTEIIHDSADETVFYPIEGKKSEEFTVLFVGNTNRKIKNFPTIVDICNRAGVKLKICDNWFMSMQLPMYV